MASDLERQLVADPRWRWEPGMLITDYGPGIRYCWQDEMYLHGADEGGSGGWMRIPKARVGTAAYLPGLSDPATAGILLSWLPLGWAMDSPSCDGRGAYAIVVDGEVETRRGPTLGEAAALALLALPPETPWGGERG